LNWLPDLDECENFIEIILFSFPSPLLDTERAFLRKPKAVQRSAIEQALEFRRLLDEKVVNNRAEIAESYGISRARVTQVLNILKLHPKILGILAVSGDAVWSERQLRDVLHLSSEDDQIAAVMEMTEPVQTAS
jgi:hypothetical protein